MATLGLVEYEDASPEVRAVYDDIMRTRDTDWINNFWKALARDPAALRRTWQSIKEIMAPGALDAVTKEMVYLAVSASNQCGYCIASHTAAARKAGMTDAMFAELMAVTGMGNETNRLASGSQGEIAERFLSGASGGRRTFVACSKEYASLISVASLHAGPKKESPTGSPWTKP